MSHIVVTLTQQDGTVVRIDDATADESLMEAARRAGVAGIVAECGGVCSCATCHVYVAEDWIGKVGEPDEVEDEMLDMVDHIRRPNSRLSCQIRLSEAVNGLQAEVAPDL
ncbi:MAG: (2Fe-2S)-binding protein [Novosphingobium sp.]|nr:(2Fe-2S)-binding protein [Novosphingobium sp.]